MKKQLTSFGIGAGVIACCLSIASPIALAATASTSPNTAGTGQALEISPPVINLTGNPGQTIHAQISLRDISSGNLIVTGQVNDFVAAGEDGTPKILLNNEDTNNPYSLKGWVGPLPILTLIPKQIKSLVVSISIPANAAPGGHYGVIRFTGRAPELQGTGVSLSASLGSLMLVTVSGPTKESLAVQEFSINSGGKTGSLFESTPINFVERLKNTGNIHEEPVGQVSITDMFGKKIAAVNVNLPPRNILPASTRKFSQPLDSSVIGNKRLFGRYNADLKITYGSSKKVLTSSTAFWIIPYRLIGSVIVLLVGGFFALRFFIKRYNQHIISQVQNKRPPTRKK